MPTLVERSVRDLGASPRQSEYTCPVCDFSTNSPSPEALGQARGNTRKFSSQRFRLWKCPRCRTIRTLGPVDYAEIYRDAVGS